MLTKTRNKKSEKVKLIACLVYLYQREILLLPQIQLLRFNGSAENTADVPLEHFEKTMQKEFRIMTRDDAHTIFAEFLKRILNVVSSIETTKR